MCKWNTKVRERTLIYVNKCANRCWRWNLNIRNRETGNMYYVYSIQYIRQSSTYSSTVSAVPLLFSRLDPSILTDLVHLDSSTLPILDSNVAAPTHGVNFSTIAGSPRGSSVTLDSYTAAPTRGVNVSTIAGSLCGFSATDAWVTKGPPVGRLVGSSHKRSRYDHKKSPCHGDHHRNHRFSTGLRRGPICGRGPRCMS